MDDTERHLYLWRHVVDEGGAGESRQGRSPRRGRRFPYHGWRTGQILSGRRIEVRRKGPARRRGRRDRAVAERRSGDSVSIGPRTGAAILAQESLTQLFGEDLS